jgi:hypothetical protein
MDALCTAFPFPYLATKSSNILPEKMWQGFPGPFPLHIAYPSQSGVNLSQLVFPLATLKKNSASVLATCC